MTNQIYKLIKELNCLNITYIKTKTSTDTYTWQMEINNEKCWFHTNANTNINTVVCCNLAGDTIQYISNDNHKTVSAYLHEKLNL